ncbi:MAG TPA: outer membrane protein assembly factor BamC [Plasticicumulans sp.]|nr:outer membrane protein assembly factor BamC [Plasticicumulans sp.]
MPKLHTPLRVAAAGTTLALLAACSSPSGSLIPDRRPDYRQAREAPTLELPPDLTSSTIDDTLKVPELNPGRQANLSDYNRERGVAGGAVASTAAGTAPRLVKTESVLLQPEGMRIERQGEQRWLVVDAPADKVWPKVREFWTSNGFLLKRDDPRIGLLETDWAENRADIPQDAIRALISKALDFAYSAPTRDKFRVRLERTGDGSGTAVYLTHYGAKEVSRGRDNESTVWEPRPEDPELEAELLSRLMVFLGASEERARAQAGVGQKAAPVQKALTRPGELGGVSGLFVTQDYSRAWRSVGAALDGGDYGIEEQDRARGLYIVEYVDRAGENRKADDNKGWFSGWFGSKSAPQPRGTRYQVRLADQGGETFVIVQNASGTPDNSAGARTLLETIARGVR